MRHLDDVGLGYFAHLGRALRLGSRLVGAGLACLIHGLFPALFTHTASGTINGLHRELSDIPAPSAAPRLTPAEAEA